MTPKNTEKDDDKGKEAPKSMAPAKKADEKPARDPLDHDGDGKKGGSAPKQETKPEADKPNTGTERAKEVGKTVETEKEPKGTDNDSIPDEDVVDNKNLGSSEATKPAESPSTEGNERNRDDGAGGVRATMGNQSLSPVVKPGVPNSPDSTTRDIPAEATKAEAAVLSKSPPDNKEENYPDDDQEHDPYGEIDPEVEKQLEKQLDSIDEAESRASEQVPYISSKEQRSKTPLGAFLRHHTTKGDDFVVYGTGKLRLTLGDLRNETASVGEIVEYLTGRGKKSNFPIYTGEGPKLTLGDLD